MLNGTKRFITNAPHAGVFTVMARTNFDIKGAGGISAFIVDSQTPGISLGKRDKKWAKGAHTCDVIFENCRIPASALIGGVEGVGFKTAMKVLDKGRLHIAALSVGAATRMLDDSLNYAIERKQFGQPIAEFQLIQAMLADSKAEIYAAKCMVLDAARLRDAGQNVSTEASCAKCLQPKCVAALLIAAYKFTAVRAISVNTPLNVFIEMFVCSASMKGPLKFNK